MAAGSSIKREKNVSKFVFRDINSDVILKINDMPQGGAIDGVIQGMGVGTLLESFGGIFSGVNDQNGVFTHIECVKEYGVMLKITARTIDNVEYVIVGEYGGDVIG